MKAEMVRRAPAVFLIVALGILSILQHGQVTAEELIPENFSVVAQTGINTMYANLETGEFVIRQDDGYLWWSNPPERDADRIARGIPKMELSAQLIVGYRDSLERTYTVNSQTGSVNRSGVSVEPINQGIRVIYDFPRDHITIPVEYTLQEDFLEARIVTDEIVEGEDSFVASISLLPYFGAGSQDDEGYMLVPDGSGSLIFMNNGKIFADAYREPVYGSDSSIAPVIQRVQKEDIRLPVFGLQKNGRGFLAVMTEGESIGYVNAWVAGKKAGYNTVYPEFLYRQVESLLLLERSFWAQEVEVSARNISAVEAVAVRYYFLPEEQSTYVGMGHKYQSYLVEEKKLLPSEYVESYPLYLDLYGSVDLTKSFLGVPYKSVEPLTTYDEAAEILQTLQDSGVEEMAARYLGWTAGGPTNEKIPVKVKPERKLGGKQGFLDLLTFADSLNIPIYPSLDLVQFQKSGRGISRFFHSAQTINRAPAYQYSYKVSTMLKDKKEKPWYLLSPVRLPEIVEKSAASLQGLGSSKLALEFFGSRVYSDFKTVDRGAAVEYFVEALEYLSQETSSILMETPNDYALPYLDHAVGVPVQSSGFDITDDSVPFYQIAIRGYLPYSTPSINLHSDPDRMILKALETGSSPLFTLVAKDPSVIKESRYDFLYSVGFDYWEQWIIDNYKMLAEVLTQVAGEKITDHRRLAPDVYETTYGNGIKVIVNYGFSDRVLEGNRIPQRGFIMVGGVN